MGKSVFAFFIARAAQGSYCFAANAVMRENKRMNLPLDLLQGYNGDYCHECEQANKSPAALIAKRHSETIAL